MRPNLQFILDKTIQQVAEMTPEQIFEHNRQLFSFTGLVYVFEYYVVMYLLYRDADELRRKELLNSEKVDLGFVAPGIRPGLQDDGVLEDFILKIGGQETREEILRLYEGFKKDVLEADSSEAMLGVLRSFLLTLIPHFEKYGLDRLSEMMPEEFKLKTMEELRGELTSS